MNGENRKNIAGRVSKECAYMAVFVALLIAVQLVLSFLPGVELVTLLFVGYAFVFGVKRGMLSATAFSLLRMLVFGFQPVVLVLYLVYYNLLTLLFGWLGGRVKQPLKSLWWLTVVACLCTASFSLADNILTPLFYGYSKRAFEAYFVASLSFMLPQIVCTALTVGLLFLPVVAAFRVAKRGLR